MLIRISLVIAILAAIGAAVINFVQVKKNLDTVITQRNEWHDKWTKTDQELTTTKNNLDKTTKELASTKSALGDMTQARDAAVAEAAAATKKADDLTAKLTKTTEERDTARQELAAYQNTGYTPQQIITFGNQIKQTQLALDVAVEEKRILTANLNKTKAELDRILHPEKHVLLPAGLKGSIVVTDPKWEFVVLNVGGDQGVLEHGELLVSRGGVLVGKVIVRSVQKDRCIANVMPGWKFADIMEGDQVIAAYPET